MAGQKKANRMSSLRLPARPENHVRDAPAIEGVRLATAEAGIRYKNRTDVLLALFDEGTTVAGVFTKSKCPIARRSNGAAKHQARQGARAGGQFRQRQCLYRQERPQRRPR